MAVCERILNICVDIEEGKICEDKNIVDVFTMIMSAQQEPLSEPFNRLTSRILLLLSVPGKYQRSIYCLHIQKYHHHKNLLT